MSSISKAITLVLTLCINISFTSFSQVTHENEQFHQVKPNAIRIKLKNEPIALKGGSFNIQSLDRLNTLQKAASIKRVFPHAGKFEKAHQTYGLHLWYEVRFSDSYEFNTIDSLCRIYQGDSNIDFAEPVFVRKHGIESSRESALQDLGDGFPDDPQYTAQWHYYNTGQSGGTTNADINLPGGWAIQTGDSNVVVAIIDQGIEYTHEDLAQNMWINPAEYNGSSGVDDDNNGFVDDIYGYGFGDNTGEITGRYHGTHVGGTVAAATNNSVGVSGIAGGTGFSQGVRLMSLAVFGTFSQGGFENSFLYAADNGAVIAQNSWGGGGRSIVLEEAITYFIERAGFDNSEENFDANIQTGPMAGGVVVFAAGNDNSNRPDAGYPASFEPVIAVASTDHNDVKSYFSNYGEWVDISAPGSEILSTYPGNGYSYLSGTSMACPHVSGVAALIVSEFGGAGFTPDQVWGRLLETADDIYSSNPGHLGMLGSGRLNAGNALASDDGIPPAAINDLSVQDQSHNSVTLTWTATGNSDHSGTASTYLIRYSPNPIDETNFDDALAVNHPIRPGASGTHEVLEVEGLETSATYYFAVKASDYFGNVSGLSNVIQATTETSPVISVHPLAFSDTLFVGNSSIHELNISNVGGSELEFKISKRDPSPTSLMKRKSLTQFKGSRERGSNDNYQTAIAVAPKSGSGRSPFFSEKNVRTGSNATLFAIDYYNNTINELDPGSGSVIHSYATPEPTTGGPNGLAYDGTYLYYVSGFESNHIYQLDPSTGSVVSQLEIPSLPTIDGLGHSGEYLYALNYSGSTIIEIDFENQTAVREIDPGVGLVGGLTFGGSRNSLFVSNSGSVIYEIDLSTAEILNTFSFSEGVWGLAYSEALGALLVANVSSGAVQALDPDDGTVMFSFDLYVSSGIAADEALSQNWLRFASKNGSVDEGNTQQVAVTLDAADLNAGVYKKDIIITSNDETRGEVSLPVTLRVEGAPKIKAEPSFIEFGEHFLLTSSEKILTVHNRGTDTLNISSTVDNPVFSIDTALFMVLPGSAQHVAVRFLPATTQSYVDSLVLYSNDPVDSIVYIPLSGLGVEPPIMELSVDSLSEELLTGGNSVQNVTVFNRGGSTLHFEISVKGAVDSTMSIQSTVPASPLQVQQIPTPNETAPQTGPVVLEGSYSGDHLSFGITDYGEIMPFQFPVGNEHLALGAWVSGYTVAYRSESTDHVTYAGYGDRSGLVPVSYTESVDDDNLAEIEVVIHTSDGKIEIRRHFTFDKREKFVHINTTLQNISAADATDVVFKSFADWDVDGVIDNSWDFDADRNMIYAFEANYAAIVSNLVPTYRDMRGWNDYTRRLTDEEFTTGPILSLDGLEILHFDLGDLSPSGSSSETQIATVFAMGESLDDLKSTVDSGIQTLNWITAQPLKGAVPAGGSFAIDVLFDAHKMSSGDYHADIIFKSNDTHHPEDSVHARLTVIGAPDIDASVSSVDFGDIFLGNHHRDTLTISNQGVDPLNVTEIRSSTPDFSPLTSTITIEPGATENLIIEFTPSSLGNIAGELIIASNDPDESEFPVELTGTGIEPPVMVVSTDSLVQELFTGQTAVQTFDIMNLNAVSPLEFNINLGELHVLNTSGPTSTGSVLADKSRDLGDAGKPEEEDLFSYRREPTTSNSNALKGIEIELETILNNLSEGYETVNGLIPDRYDFLEGFSSYYINDGGDDMYDGGNRLSTSLGGYIEYNNNNISSSSYLGGGEYFTAKYPGLFVFAADLQSVNEFLISGNLGADGAGTADGSVLSFRAAGKNYLLFVKRVYDVWEPSVNHLIIIEDNGIASHEFSTNTNSDHHRIFNLEGVNRLYYLLFAGQTGRYIDDSRMTSIAQAFLALSGHHYLTVEPSAGIVGPGENLPVEVTFDARNLNGGIYTSDIVISSNDPNNSKDTVHTKLSVTGAPNIELSHSEVTFGSIWVGSSSRDSLIIANAGSEPLVISNISTSNSNFDPTIDTITIAPQEAASLFIDFVPSIPGHIAGELTIYSNDPDQENIFVQLHGVGIAPPAIEVSIDSLHADLYGENVYTSQIFEISNENGGSPLEFSLTTGEINVIDSTGPMNLGRIEKEKNQYSGHRQVPAFEEVYTFDRHQSGDLIPTLNAIEDLASLLENLNDNFEAVNSVIPNKYDFYEGEFGSGISDGGDDMYDGGNYLSTNAGGTITYTNGLLSTSPSLGGGNYFTAKYPGLFVFAGELNGATDFYIDGNLGADGSGATDGVVLTLPRGGRNYLVFVKRVYDAWDPSVNHVVIVEDNGIASHEFSFDTNNDYHRIFDLEGVDHLYYLLFAAQSGDYIDNEAITSIATAFLDQLEPNFLVLSPTYGILQPGERMNIEASFNAENLEYGVYQTTISLHSNDPIAPHLPIPARLRYWETVPLPSGISLSNSSIDENKPEGSVVGDLEVVQAFEGPIHYSFEIMAGEDPSLFSINEGQLVANERFNFEETNSFTLTIRVTDNFGGAFEDDFTIQINDVNDKPYKIVLTNTEISENKANGSVVGKLSALDEDLNDVHEFSLTSGFPGNGLYQISGDQLLTNSIFDFEEQPTHEINVRVQDQNGGILEETLVIHLINAEDLPSKILLDRDQIEENSPIGTVVGRFTTLDQDVNDTSQVYRLISGNGDTDNEMFVIEEDRLLTQKEIDFEETSSLSLRVISFDTEGTFIEQDISIEVIDLDDEITSVGDDPDGINIDLFPNPVTENRVRLLVKGRVQNEIFIGIYTVLGQLQKEIRLAKESEVKEIDVSELPEGIFIVNIRVNDLVVIKKMKKGSQ